MQLIELAAQYRATGNALRARAATLRLELAAMPRAGRARRDLEARIARLEQMAGETLCTASYLAHYYDRSVTYTGTAYRVLQGIDVSTFQQDIDWQAVADSGIAFAVIRAGYRGYGKGGIVEDDRFRQNVAGACAAGLRVGLYFFSQAVTPEEAAEEAQWLVDAARDYKIDMPLVFDWENIDQSTVAAGDTVRTAEMTGEDVTACAVAFCETVTAAGYDAAVYGNRWQGYYDYDFAQLKDYAFWVSAPGTADDFYYAHDFWQYSYDGTVPGVSGSVDRDLWFVPITT